MSSTISEKDLVLLAFADRRIIVRAGEGVRRVEGIGTMDTSRLVGLRWGSRLDHPAGALVALPPRLTDHVARIRRSPQIVLPKDMGVILVRLGVRPGMRVLELGTGSGALTLALAHAVAPSGRVTTMDLRPEHSALAMANLEAAGLLENVEFVVGDACGPLPVEGPFDACAMDLPEPWRALPGTEAVLAPGAFASCYTPSVNQAESVLRALRERGWIDCLCTETFQREMVLTAKGFRPSYETLAHTGYVTTARWTGSSR